MALLAAASAIKLSSDPNLRSYKDSTWQLDHYKGESLEALGYDDDGNKWPYDYFVPNFGQDSDVATTLNSVAESEAELNHNPNWTAPPAAGHPVDYFVPNFGPDHDILATRENLAVAEAATNHTWVWVDKSRDIPPVVPYYSNGGPGLDSDIKDTQAHLTLAEQQTGHNWVIAE